MNRVALVIGNSEYLNIGKLNNPKNDANDIASILDKLNFDVEKVIDADLLDIQRSVNKFLQALDEYAVGLFFYAGHGMQIDGKNYIVPVDLKLGDKSRTTVSCYCLNSLLDGAATYKGKTLICILDACRDNPFAIGRGLIAGFAPFDNPPKGTIIAYSTGSDCSAFDGHGSNGLYTQVLKDAMLIPNLKIEDMFKSVRKNVSDISISQYGQEQLSWEYSSLVGDFYFSVTSQPVNEHISDDEIYTFVRARRKLYENDSEDIHDIECMPYVDAYDKYHIPIVKILRAYSRIDFSKKGLQFSDATIDQINSNHLVPMELQAVRADRVLEVVSTPHGRLQVERQCRFVRTEKAAQHIQPFRSVQLVGGRIEPRELGGNLARHTGKECACFVYILFVNGNRDKPLLFHAGGAAGDLAFQHPVELVHESVEAVAALREQDGIFKRLPVDLLVADRELGGRAAVQSVQQFTVAEKHGSLVLFGRDGIVDV